MLSSNILSSKNDHTTTVDKEARLSKELENATNEKTPSIGTTAPNETHGNETSTSKEALGIETTASKEADGIGTNGTVQRTAGDDQHSGSSPHRADVQSTILLTPPSDGNSTAVVLSDGSTVEVHSTVASGVQSSAGYSTVGSSTVPGKTPEQPDVSKDNSAAMVGQQTTSGFQMDWSGKTISDINVSENISGISTHLLSSIVDAVTVRGRVDLHSINNNNVCFVM